jgi:hypothetical protein
MVSTTEMFLENFKRKMKILCKNYEESLEKKRRDNEISVEWFKSIQPQTYNGVELSEWLSLSGFEKLIIEMESEEPADFEKLDWTTISSYKDLSETFMNKYYLKLNWSVICTNQMLTFSFIEKYIHFIDFKAIFTTHKGLLPKEFIAQHIDKITKKEKKLKQKTKKENEINDSFEDGIWFLQREFPKEFYKLDWSTISCYKKLSEEFIEKYADQLNWNQISTHQRLSEHMLRKYIDKINFKSIGITHINRLSLDFIFENRYNLNVAFIKTNKKFTCPDYKVSYSEKLEDILEKRERLGFYDDITVM